MGDHGFSPPREGRLKLRLVALGSKMPAWVEAGYTEYAQRMPRELAIELVEMKPERRDRGRSPAQWLAAEAVRIRSACEGYRMVALDERGQPWSTQQLSAHLLRWKDEATDVAFVIGSADGLDASLRQAAPHIVALSALTLPHAMVRIVLAEQLYRAASIIAGHPYHRD